MSTDMVVEEASGPAIFDSLPYYDNDIEQHPILKEKVEKELAREAKPPQTLHPRVPPAPQLFANHPLLEAELTRIESHQPLVPLDTTRYQLPGPSHPDNEDEWKTALSNAHAQLEHQRLRHQNLSLLQSYGANSWRIHNYLTEADAKNIEKALEDLRNLTTEVNRERKNFQTRIGNQLTSLETRWTELISSILQIEMANVALEVEIARINKAEAELAAGS
ncbi:breast carcinoma amplified sequence 2 [Laetiporus sulphureus 93-53]|uniref:Breast carcinoma amplified sequence 2 n=1 Tax=Laetiporus sulphureus 93-53 TaxID=1314785 RepID=A0A165E740_9APHY|nr:breast carcinoma amplified sequence 2 [Laetiporus sulphureus 93-53]KZT06367.1 breast carcinoma amplified sequence 2 [Laetiporus sulphureus 93-53]